MKRTAWTPAASQGRRQFLKSSLRACSAALLGASLPRLDLSACLPVPGPPCGPDPFAAGRLLGTLPLTGRGAADIQLEVKRGRGLDARLLTDLSSLTSDTLVIPNERYYIRTTHPDLLTAPSPLKLSVQGLVKRRADILLDELEPLAVPLGPYVMECAGNTNPNNFGLMSAARWTGIPIREVLAKADILPRATRVLVSGFDQHSQPSRTSVPGASWIFTFEELESAGAFLATGMNGEPLPADHGAPIRLIVPRWYGCACIKWVNEIVLVDDNEPATSQMQEFASRTFQNGRPKLAREYKPALIDHAAMPVRIDKWLVGGKIVYRVVGILWGGAKVTSALRIRFNPREPYVPVDICPEPTTTDTWTLWWHAWRPPAAGRYQIVLRIDDPSVRTDRLDMYFYTREVMVEEI